MIFYVLVSPCAYHRTVSVMVYLTAYSNKTNFSVTTVNLINRANLQLLSIILIIAPCDREGSVRLTGGSTAQEGLLELCHKGQYSSICLEEVSLSQATFVCSELGFTGGK